MQNISTNKELFKSAHEIARRSRKNEDNASFSYAQLFRAALKYVWKIAKGTAKALTRSAKEAGKMIATIFHFDGKNAKARAKAEWKMDRDFSHLRPWEVKAAWEYAEDQDFQERYGLSFQSSAINDKIAQYNTYCH